MRNLLGGLLGTILGSWLLSFLLNLSQPAYPPEVAGFWMILAGSYNLSQSYFSILNPLVIGPYLLVWLVIGLVIAPFSKSGWNAVRTALWTGVWVSMWAVSSILLLNPDFWTDANRNWDLLVLFTSTIVTANIALISAYPMHRLMLMTRIEKDRPIPERIETICECGARFRSVPLICSECGRQLSGE